MVQLVIMKVLVQPPVPVIAGILYIAVIGRPVATQIGVIGLVGGRVAHPVAVEQKPEHVLVRAQPNVVDQIIAPAYLRMSNLATPNLVVVMMVYLAVITILAELLALITVEAQYRVVTVLSVVTQIGVIGQIGAPVLSLVAVARKPGRAVAKARLPVAAIIIALVCQLTLNLAILKLAVRRLILTGAVGQTPVVVPPPAAAAPRRSLAPAKARLLAADRITAPVYLHKPWIVTRKAVWLMATAVQIQEHMIPAPVDIRVHFAVPV